MNFIKFWLSLASKDPKGHQIFVFSIKLWSWFLHNIADTFHESVDKLKETIVSWDEAGNEYFFTCTKTWSGGKIKCFLQLKAKKDLADRVIETDGKLILRKLHHLELWKA